MSFPRMMGLLLCAVAISSCTSTHQVGYDIAQTRPEDMLRSLAGEEVTVELHGSGSLTGTLLPGSSDTVRLQATGPDTTLCLPVNTIETIEAGGSLVGPILGFAGGAAVGSLIGGAIGGGESGSGMGESFGALFGAAVGGAIGLAVGAGLTPAHRYELPPDGTQIRKRSDDITIQSATIVRETDLSITIRWYSRTTTLPKDQISIQKKAGEIFIKAPRSLLYEGDKPRYIDD